MKNNRLMLVLITMATTTLLTPVTSKSISIKGFVKGVEKTVKPPAKVRKRLEQAVKPPAKVRKRVAKALTPPASVKKLTIRGETEKIKRSTRRTYKRVSTPHRSIRKEVNKVKADVREFGDLTMEYQGNVISSTRDLAKGVAVGIATGDIDKVGKSAESYVNRVDESTRTYMNNSTIAAGVASIGAEVLAPGVGAAAFNAYRVGGDTGSLEEAVKAGVVTYVTGTAMTAANGVSASSAVGVTTRTVASGAVGGVSQLASGGKLEDGILAGVQVAVTGAIYESFVGHRPDMRPASKGPVSAPKGDISLLNSQHTFVGLENSSNFFFGEGGAMMTSASRIPGVNAGAKMHDIWASRLPKSLNQPTIPPAMAITMSSSPTVVNDKIHDNFVTDSD